MKYFAKNNALLLTGLALLSTGVIVVPAHADNTMQTIELVSVDVQKLSTGYRVSKLIGSNVVNDAGETIGRIEDLIVSPDDNKSAYVIISVGGWLNMGSHLIALPYDNLRITKTKITLPGATKDGLRNLSEFKFSTMY
jgi:sporulation protein YlmC with PRC-barrel domain